MKQPRWMKAVIATAQSKETANVVLPWQRGEARQQMVVTRRTASKVKRSA